MTGEERTHLRFLRSVLVALGVVSILIQWHAGGWDALVLGLFGAAMLALTLIVNEILRSTRGHHH